MLKDWHEVLHRRLLYEDAARTVSAPFNHSWSSWGNTTLMVHFAGVSYAARRASIIRLFDVLRMQQCCRYGLYIDIGDATTNRLKFEFDARLAGDAK